MKYLKRLYKFSHQELEYVFVKHGFAHLVSESEHRVAIVFILLVVPMLMIFVIGYMTKEKVEKEEDCGKCDECLAKLKKTE